MPRGLSPSAAVIALARQKAASVCAQLRAEKSTTKKTWVLGSDTVVYLSEEALGKPRDDADARQMLARLAGRKVDVVTGVVLMNVNGTEILEGSCCSTCTMCSYSSADIDAYVATGEPRDKAGSFAIQGLGSALVAELKGSRSNVIGLPKSLVMDLLAKAGF